MDIYGKKKKNSWPTYATQLQLAVTTFRDTSWLLQVEVHQLATGSLGAENTGMEFWSPHMPRGPQFGEHTTRSQQVLLASNALLLPINTKTLPENRLSYAIILMRNSALFPQEQ